MLSARLREAKLRVRLSVGISVRLNVRLSIRLSLWHCLILCYGTLCFVLCKIYVRSNGCGLTLLALVGLCV